MKTKFVVYNKARVDLSHFQASLAYAISLDTLTSVSLVEQPCTGEIIAQLNFTAGDSPARVEPVVLPWCSSSELQEKVSDLEVRLIKNNKQLKHLAIVPLTNSIRVLVVAIVEDGIAATRGVESDEQQPVVPANEEAEQNSGAAAQPDGGAKRPGRVGNRKASKVS